MIENNWMTRFLCNKLGGQLTANDEALAREVLRQKCLIGLLSRKNESFQRFKTSFQWKINDGDPQKVDCEEKYLEWGWEGKIKYTPVKEDSEEWKELRKANTFDLRLYEYAEKLFEVQGVLMDDGGHVEYLEPVVDVDVDVVPVGVGVPDNSVDSSTSDSNVIDLIASNLININN